MLTVLTPAPSYDLTTVETVKAELALTTATDDSFLASLIHQASADIARYCMRTLALEEVRETFQVVYSPSGNRWRYGSIFLSRWPVAEVASVTEGETVLVEGTDYQVDRATGALTRQTGASFVFATGWAGGVTVEYSGGYDLLPGLPHDIERAAIDLIKRRYFARSRDPALRSQQVLDLVNKSFTAESSEPTKRGLPLSIAERLDQYVSLS